MNKLLFIILLTAGLGNQARAQTARTFFNEALQEPYHLSVSDQKTTILVFPAPIANNGVDRGTGDILAKTVTGVDNVLKVKGAAPSFPQTNLTVITTNGKIYAFRVDYSTNPDDRPIDMGKQQLKEAQAAFFKSRTLNDAQVEMVARSITRMTPFMTRPREKMFKMSAVLDGIYTCEDVIFYRLSLKNSSPIAYDLDFLRFYVKDKKGMKRTAEQEKELQPLYVYKELDNRVPVDGRGAIVVAFPKFTIADKKHFIMQLFEKGGDRHLQLKMEGTDIMRARPLKYKF